MWLIAHEDLFQLYYTWKVRSAQMIEKIVAFLGKHLHICSAILGLQRVAVWLAGALKYKNYLVWSGLQINC